MPLARHFRAFSERAKRPAGLFDADFAFRIILVTLLALPLGLSVCEMERRQCKGKGQYGQQGFHGHLERYERCKIRTPL